MIERVVLVGLSGAGKSTTARLIGAGLGWTVIDLDQVIQSEAGRSIPDIFRTEGEAHFRSLEAGVFQRALAQSNVVIATGGGAVTDPAMWEEHGLGNPQTLSVWLDASTEQLVDRLRRQAGDEGDGVRRPLLEGDPFLTIGAMREQRTPAYSRATVTLDVTERHPADVARDVAALVRLGRGEATVELLEVERAASRIRVAPGIRLALAEVIREQWPDAQQVFVACDAGVAPRLGDTLDHLERGLQRSICTCEIPAGESSKSVEGLSQLWDWLLEGGVQRGDVLVAIGGGMVGDLAGFAAATVLRGIGLLHVPTTLLSMVDSSVGGKTAINHRTGKNLIGSFHQARAVLIDPSFLSTLPERERRSGWAEIIKHAVIEGSTPGGKPAVLLDVLERNHGALLRLDEPLLSWVIGRNVAVKAAVVAADEREAGIRAFLNFGHTIGHGIEAAGYSLLHGEAVAVGMSAALNIATQMDLIDSAFAARIRNLIQTFGLPLFAEVDPVVVLNKMSADKKKLRGRQAWVLPQRDGSVALHHDVPDDVVQRAISSVIRHG
jgi:shikimate kinase/3-dehydroquinate synthase